LVLAFFKKNKEESTKLKAKNIVSNDVWQTLVTSSSY
jgi:hypothetical protein